MYHLATTIIAVLGIQILPLFLRLPQTNKSPLFLLKLISLLEYQSVRIVPQIKISLVFHLPSRGCFRQF